MHEKLKAILEKAVDDIRFWQDEADYETYKKLKEAEFALRDILEKEVSV